MSPKRVLVINDDPSVRLRMESILQAQGAEVHLAKNDIEGLAILKRSPMDVLFVDVDSSETDAVRIATEAGLLVPRIATVLVTGRSDSPSPVTAGNNSGCDCMTRPITSEKIRAAMARACAGGRAPEGDGAAPSRQRAVTGPTSHGALVATSRDMRRVVLLANQLAEKNVPVLIQGEKGVGKALLARAIHHRRRFDPGSFVHLVCNGMREDHVASLLASSPRAGDALPAGKVDGGVWNPTRDGSVFLENIEELPFWAQSKLVDVLERGGETSSARLRVIASTSCDLKTAASEGRVPQDLYYLLSVAPIRVPPLRCRREDIRPLAERMLERFVRQLGPRANDDVRFSARAWGCLLAHDWPGNGDELSNVLQRAVLLGRSSQIEAEDLEQLLLDNRSVATTKETITVALEGDFKSIQRQIIHEVINRCSGNKAAAARSLGLHRKTVYRLLQGAEPRPIVDFAGAAGGIDVPITAPSS